MLPSSMQPAELSEPQMNQVRTLEKDLNTCVVAWDVAAAYAELTPEQLLKLQATEKGLGKVLLAYDCRPR